MAEIKIQGPDGSSFSFPVGTASEVIEGAMKSHYSNYKGTGAKPVDPDAPGMLETAARGAADTLTFGLADEAFGVGRGVKSLMKGGEFGAGYDEGKAEYGARSEAGAKANPITSVGGQLAGGLFGGVGLAKAGLSATANAIKAGKALPAVAMAGAKEGLALGTLHGAGSGEGIEGRLEGAAKGGAGGLALGGAAPYAIAGVGAVAKPLVAPLMARLRPDEYANSAIGEGMKRAGMSADDVAAALRSAREDGQEVFNVADAMGNAGQRMLSTAARNPHDERQALVEAIMGRQMDQGRRVAGSLQDASGTRLTAAQLSDELTAQRAANAGRNYQPVETDMTAINVSRPVGLANRAISPAADNIAQATGAVPTDLAARSGIEAGEAAIRDPIRQAVKEARSYLASDTLTVTNVEKAFRAKTNIDAMIADATANNRGGVVDALKPIRDALDDKLAKTSTNYAAARDAYRTDSQPIEAIATGRGMASPRTRTQDNLATFGGMDEASQNAARVGYFDPMIARAESAAGTMTNAARPFSSDSMRRELPAFAAPGQGELLGRRLGREMTMSESARSALGGSKTADNLADAAEMAKFDPGIMTSLFQGRPVQAIVAALAKGKNEASGLPPRVIERIAKNLLETDPDNALRLLSAASGKTASSDKTRALATAIMQNLGAATAGRLAAP